MTTSPKIGSKSIAVGYFGKNHNFLLLVTAFQYFQYLKVGKTSVNHETVFVCWCHCTVSHEEWDDACYM